MVTIMVTAFVAALVVELVTFGFALRLKRHSIVDIAWGTGFAVVAVAGFLVSTGEGADETRRVLVTVLTAVWGLRLGGHILLRQRHEHSSGEDPRYEELMAKAKGNPDFYAFRSVYLLQALALWFVSLPVQVALVLDGDLGVLAYLGVALWAVGFFFEAVGDWQLTQFRNDPSTKGKVMDRGLWRYTRHPNYFGDACVWWGLFLLAADAGWWGVATLPSPLLMSWLLSKKTGKPLMEKQLSSRRPGYAEYVERTSGFFPLPPRK